MSQRRVRVRLRVRRKLRSERPKFCMKHVLWQHLHGCTVEKILHQRCTTDPLTSIIDMTCHLWCQYAHLMRGEDDSSDCSSQLLPAYGLKHAVC